MAREDLALRFGELVRRLRLEKGLSQERLAELCGMHRNYVGAVERAERTPSIVAADNLAKALGTTLSSMFSELERDFGGSDDG
jgi:transcriptional regulator with XRE-family HTH domain